MERRIKEHKKEGKILKNEIRKAVKRIFARKQERGDGK